MASQEELRAVKLLETHSRNGSREGADLCFTFCDFVHPLNHPVETAAEDSVAVGNGDGLSFFEVCGDANRRYTGVTATALVDLLCCVVFNIGTTNYAARPLLRI